MRSTDSAGGGGDPEALAARIGTSGWNYPRWRGDFYPDGLAQRRELEYLSARLATVEINGSFYSLQRASSYRRWATDVPDGFLFAVKGSRFITHMKRLRDVDGALANFFASGMLALGPALGPVLWQLPPTLAFDPGSLEPFLASLPRSTTAASDLARGHDERVKDPCVQTDADRPLRHALEVRHPSFRDPAFVRLVREHDVASVVADTAGTFPCIDDVTSDLAYVRLHGDTELYASGYTDEALDRWADRVVAWVRGDRPVSEATVDVEGAADAPRPREVLVYFDNDIKVHAPFDAQRLAARVSRRLGDGHADGGG